MSDTKASDGPALRPVAEVRDTLPAGKGQGTRLVVEWFAALTEGRIEDAVKLMVPEGPYFLLRQRKTITNSDFGKVIEALIGPTFKRPIAWSLGDITEEGNQIAAIAGSFVPLTGGGTYENLYHFLFRTKGDLIEAVFEFGDTARSAQTFAKPPGEH